MGQNPQKVDKIIISNTGLSILIILAHTLKETPHEGVIKRVIGKILLNRICRFLNSYQFLLNASFVHVYGDKIYCTVHTINLVLVTPDNLSKIISGCHLF